MFLNKKSTSRAFTLLEILLVVGIIAILAGIVIIAINPAKQLADTRNAERRSDIRELNSAMQQYYIDNGRFPTSTPTTLTEICDTGATAYPSGVSCGSLVDLPILVPTYIPAIPVDPSGASSTLSLIPRAEAATGGTGYKIVETAANQIALTAPLAELNVPIALGTTTASGGGAPDTLGVGLVASRY